MVNENEITDSIILFKNHIDSAPGHKHMYDEFDKIIHNLSGYRKNGGSLNAYLAKVIFDTIECLLWENSQGRRPFLGMWETYFAACMRNSHRLLTEVSLFIDYRQYIPNEFCNKCLDMFIHMDRFVQEFELREFELRRRWLAHFKAMARQAAEMFSLTADSGANLNEKLLDDPDDDIFTWLLRGFSMSVSPDAEQILNNYMEDNEAWVRSLAIGLFDERKKRYHSFLAKSTNEK